MSNQIPFLEIGGSSYEQGFRHGDVQGDVDQNYQNSH